MAQSLAAGPAQYGRRPPASAGVNRLRQEGNLPDLCPADPIALRNPDFLRYLQSRFAGALEERFHATYSDGRGHYLHDEVLVRGTPDSVGLRSRQLFGRALALGATGLVLAHNHPSGECRPSSDDLSATNRMRDIASALDMVLLDHLILARDEIYSMRLGGYL